MRCVSRFNSNVVELNINYVSLSLSLSLFQINNNPYILPNVTLAMRWNDTKGDTVVATRAMTEMICDGVATFFGPEGSCNVEGIVSQSRNIPMISYVSIQTVCVVQDSLERPHLIPTFRNARTTWPHRFRRLRGLSLQILK